MLEKDPQNRPSPGELLSHKLFGNLDMKESVTETAETNSMVKMNQIHQSLQPKSMTALKALSSFSPKV